MRTFKEKVASWLLSLREYYKEYIFFNKYNMRSAENTFTVGYHLMLLGHSLEKGMSIKNPRVGFGNEKAIQLVREAKNYIQLGGTTEDDFFYINYLILSKWFDYYQLNEWKMKFQDEIEDFISEYKNVKNMGLVAGSMVKTREELVLKDSFNYLEFLKGRHTVRDYSEEIISDKDFEYCLQCAMLTPSACNRQMVSVTFVRSHDKRAYITKQLQGTTGLNIQNAQYFVIAYSTSSLSFYGERNQGFLNAGLFAMNFINALHSRGIGTCPLQYNPPISEEIKLKKACGLSEDKRIALVIAAGYYPQEGAMITASLRRNSKSYSSIC